MSGIIYQKTNLSTNRVFASVVDVAHYFGIAPEPLRIVHHQELDLLALVDQDGAEIAYKGVSGALWGTV